jgi:hypothetical protein
MAGGDEAPRGGKTDPSVATGHEDPARSGGRGGHAGGRRPSWADDRKVLHRANGPSCPDFGNLAMRGRERGPLVTRRVGWIMAIGWGVPLLVAVVPELSWDAAAAHPWWSALLALVFVALVRAPAVGRSLEG